MNTKSKELSCTLPLLCKIDCLSISTSFGGNCRIVLFESGPILVLIVSEYQTHPSVKINLKIQHSQ